MGAKCKTCVCCLKGTGLWMLITAVALAFGLGLGFGMFGQKSRNLRPTDMREITEGLSTVFCSGVDVYAWTNDMDVYMLPHRPSIDPETRQIFTIQERTTVAGRYYQSWQYYLLEGSIVSLNSSCDTQLEMYVFQGYQNYESFINNKLCEKCYVHHETFQGNTFYELNKTETDDYYFVYVNRNMQQSENLVVDFFLNRTLYDVRNLIPCLYDWDVPCHFDFQMGSEESIVVQIEHSQTSASSQIFSTCYGRIWLYVVLFVFPALLLGSMTCVLLCRKHKKSRFVNSERQPFANDALNTYPTGGLIYSVQYSPQVDGPPAYDAATASKNPTSAPSTITSQ